MAAERLTSSIATTSPVMKVPTTSHRDEDDHAKTAMSSLAVVPHGVPDRQRDDDGKASLPNSSGDGSISGGLETASYEKDNTIASTADDHSDQQRDHDGRAKQLPLEEPQAEGSHLKEETLTFSYVTVFSFQKYANRCS